MEDLAHVFIMTEYLLSIIFTQVSTRLRQWSLPFQYYVSDYLQLSLVISSYADDFTAAARSSDYRAASAIFASHASDKAGWSRIKSLSISLTKSQSHTPPSLSLTPINFTSTLASFLRRHTLLEVSFDIHVTFTPYINYITKRCASRLRTLKVLAIALPIEFLSSCPLPSSHPLNHPQCRPCMVSERVQFQGGQATCLRIASGSLRMASISTLHRVCSMLSVAGSLWWAGSTLRSTPPWAPHALRWHFMSRFPGHTGDFSLYVLAVC